METQEKMEKMKCSYCDDVFEDVGKLNKHMEISECRNDIYDIIELKRKMNKQLEELIKEKENTSKTLERLNKKLKETNKEKEKSNKELIKEKEELIKEKEELIKKEEKIVKHLKKAKEIKKEVNKEVKQTNIELMNSIKIKEKMLKNFNSKKEMKDEIIKLKDELKKVKEAYIYVLQKNQIKINDINSPNLEYFRNNKSKDQITEIFLDEDLIEILNNIIQLVYNDLSHPENHSIDLTYLEKTGNYKVYINNEWIIISSEKFINILTRVYADMINLYDNHIGIKYQEKYSNIEEMYKKMSNKFLEKYQK